MACDILSVVLMLILLTLEHSKLIVKINGQPVLGFQQSEVVPLIGSSLSVVMIVSQPAEEGQYSTMGHAPAPQDRNTAAPPAVVARPKALYENTKDHNVSSHDHSLFI